MEEHYNRVHFDDTHTAGIELHHVKAQYSLGTSSSREAADEFQQESVYSRQASKERTGW